MHDNVRCAAVIGIERGFEFSGALGGDGVCPPHKRQDGPDTSETRDDSRRVRDEHTDCEATLAEPRTKRRVYVEADRKGNDTRSCRAEGGKSRKKGKQRTYAMDAGYGVQHKGRRRDEKAATQVLRSIYEF